MNGTNSSSTPFTRRVPSFRDALRAKQQARGDSHVHDLEFLRAVRSCFTVDDVHALRLRQRDPIPLWRDVALTRALALVAM